jgi:hypothetical protein
MKIQIEKKKKNWEGIGVCVCVRVFSVRIVARLRRIRNRMRIHRGNQYRDDVRSLLSLSLCSVCVLFSLGDTVCFLFNLVVGIRHDIHRHFDRFLLLSYYFFLILSFEFYFFLGSAGQGGGRIDSTSSASSSRIHNHGPCFID